MVGADVAGYGLAHMETDADACRVNLARRVELVETLENFPRSVNRVDTLPSIVDGRAKNRHEAVAEKFINNALVLVDDVDMKSNSVFK